MRIAIDDIVAEVEASGNEEDLGLIAARVSADRYLLVEKNAGAGGCTQTHYFSTHASLEDAAVYWVGQEYREDWEPLMLVDLETDRRWEPELAIHWVDPRG